MKNKKYINVDRYDGNVTFITFDEGETIEDITEGLKLNVGALRSWDGEEYIIIELPAWGSKQKQP